MVTIYAIYIDFSLKKLAIFNIYQTYKASKHPLTEIILQQNSIRTSFS